LLTFIERLVRWVFAFSASAKVLAEGREGLGLIGKITYDFRRSAV
jgi:hypothetical protein